MARMNFILRVVWIQYNIQYNTVQWVFL